MGTFEGHWLPGTAFVVLGLWHLSNTIAAYVAAPSSFHTRAWFPAPLPGGWRFLELYFIALGALCSISAELVVAQPGHWMLDAQGHIPVTMLAQFEHASMSLFFLLYALIALFTEGACSTRVRPLPFGFLHCLAACALAQEYLLFFFHSGDHMGIEGHYHTLLRIPIGLALLCALLEIAYPTFYLLPILRSAALLLQGLLLIQTAFSVWVPTWVSLHCTATVGHTAAHCETDEWTHRAKGIANLQFNWCCAFLLLFTVLYFLVLRAVLGTKDSRTWEAANPELRPGSEARGGDRGLGRGPGGLYCSLDEESAEREQLKMEEGQEASPSHSANHSPSNQSSEGGYDDCSSHNFRQISVGR